MLLILTLITPLFLILDLFRNQPSPLGAKIRGLCRMLFLEMLFRSHEKQGSLSGASYMLISALTCLIILPKEIFIIAFAILIIADTFAALVGKSIGKTKIIGSKTLAGTTTFFLSSIAIAASLSSFFGLNIYTAMMAAGVSTIAELYSEKMRVDDNLLIPVTYGICSLMITYLV
jgi:dolichol kinase